MPSGVTRDGACLTCAGGAAAGPGAASAGGLAGAAPTPSSAERTAMAVLKPLRMAHGRAGAQSARCQRGQLLPQSPERTHRIRSCTVHMRGGSSNSVLESLKMSPDIGTPLLSATTSQRTNRKRTQAPAVAHHSVQSASRCTTRAHSHARAHARTFDLLVYQPGMGCVHQHRRHRATRGQRHGAAGSASAPAARIRCGGLAYVRAMAGARSPLPSHSSITQPCGSAKPCVATRNACAAQHARGSAARHARTTLPSAHRSRQHRQHPAHHISRGAGAHVLQSGDVAAVVEAGGGVGQQGVGPRAAVHDNRGAVERRPIGASAHRAPACHGRAPTHRSSAARSSSCGPHSVRSLLLDCRCMRTRACLSPPPQ